MGVFNNVGAPLMASQINGAYSNNRQDINVNYTAPIQTNQYPVMQQPSYPPPSYSMPSYPPPAPYYPPPQQPSYPPQDNKLQLILGLLIGLLLSRKKSCPPPPQVIYAPSPGPIESYSDSDDTNIVTNQVNNSVDNNIEVS